MKILDITARATLAIITVTFLWTCKKNPVAPSKQQPQATLSLQEVTTNEAWLTMTYTARGSFLLTRDGTPVATGRLSARDTTIIDDSLVPERTYTYQAILSAESDGSYSSEVLQVRTMDTTSHDITWQTFTLGDGNSSVLNDVVIVNDTLIYAVGAVYLQDSTGQINPVPYNLATWRGSSWTLSRIYFPAICGQAALYSFPAIAGFEMSATDVWIAEDGNAIARWRGHAQSAPQCVPITLWKLWGSDSNSMYGVGYAGGVVHYNGSQWRALNSPTNYFISNIWGDGTRLLCVTTESKILSISSETVSETIYWSGIPIRGIWFAEGTPIYVSGQGVWINDGVGWKQMSDLPNAFYTAIKGTAPNDLFVVGAYGMAAHYNGSTWCVYTEIQNPVWNFQSVAVNNDIVAAVGSESVSIGGQAVVAIGTRTK